MNKTRFLAIVGLFAAAAANASAQAEGAQFSVSYFGIYTSDSSVVVTDVGGGPYESTPYVSGSGYNLLFSGQYNGYGGTSGYNVVENYSVAPGPGSADQFNGLNYYYDITNTSLYTQGFTVDLDIEQAELVEGDGSATSYAGIREFGGAGIYNYHTVSLNSYGPASEYVVGAFTDTYAYNIPGYYSRIDSSGAFGDTLNPGESVEIEVWASGYTSAITPASTPGPEAAIPFALAAVAAGRRRRRRA
jgi:uncharacterized protein (TIGR03382 family)